MIGNKVVVRFVYGAFWCFYSHEQSHPPINSDTFVVMYVSAGVENKELFFLIIDCFFVFAHDHSGGNMFYGVNLTVNVDVAKTKKRKKQYCIGHRL